MFLIFLLMVYVLCYCRLPLVCICLLHLHSWCASCPYVSYAWCLFHLLVISKSASQCSSLFLLKSYTYPVFLPLISLKLKRHRHPYWEKNAGKVVRILSWLNSIKCSDRACSLLEYVSRLFKSVPAALTHPGSFGLL